MPAKEVTAVYKGKKIRVRNTWLSGAKLYIDDNCKDTCYEFFAVSGSKPLLTARINTDEETDVIEVYFRAIFTTNIAIHANGKFLAGDNFKSLAQV